MTEATTSGTTHSVPVVPDPSIRYSPSSKVGTSYRVRGGKPATRDTAKRDMDERTKFDMDPEEALRRLLRSKRR